MSSQAQVCSKEAEEKLGAKENETGENWDHV